jgi:hypothetical protein
MYVAYVDRMVKEMRATIPPLPKKIGQEASTQRILDRPESEDEAWQKRPMPTWEEARAVPGAKNPYDMSWDELDSFVGKRQLDPHEIEIVTRLRHSGRGHTFGDAISEGATGATEESKERAVNALIYSPPAVLTDDDKRRIASLTKIEKPPAPEPKPEQPKSGRLKRFKFWWGSE